MRIFAADPRVASVQLGRALEAMQQADDVRTYTHDQKLLIRPIFRTMATGTRALAIALRQAIEDERKEFLSRAPVRESARKYTKVHESDDPDLDQWLKAIDAMGPAGIERALRNAYEAMYEQGVSHVRAEINGAFDLTPDRALAALEAHAMAFSIDVIVQEKLELKALIKDAFERGIDPRELAGDIAAHFEDGITRGDRTIDVDAWSVLVARTETARAQNAGALDGYAAAGLETVIWMTADDERVCPYCNALDGRTTRTGEPFPGTEVTAPPLHPACRCGIVSLNDVTKSLVRDP